MDKDQNKLIEYLDGKFTKIDKNFVKIDEKFAKIDKNFVKIDEKFAKIDKNFVKIDEEFWNIDIKLLNVDEKLKDIQENKADKSDINRLMDIVDAYMKQGEEYRQEMLMLSHKVDRHEKWIQQIADKLGVKLEY